jgi:hypothetical protein
MNNIRFSNAMPLTQRAAFFMSLRNGSLAEKCRSTLSTTATRSFCALYHAHTIQHPFNIFQHSATARKNHFQHSTTFIVSIQQIV